MKKDEELVKIWYYADRTMRNYDNAEMTPRLRYLVPEWYDKGTGQVNLRPTARDLGRGNLEKRTGRSEERRRWHCACQLRHAFSNGKIPDVQVGEGLYIIEVSSRQKVQTLLK